MAKKVEIMGKETRRMQHSFTHIIDITIAVYLFSIFTIGSHESLYVFSRLLALVLMGLLAAYALMKGSIKLPTVAVIYGAFTIWCFITAIWAYNIDLAFTKSTTMAQLFILLFLLYFYLDTEDKFDHLIATISTAGTIFAIYVIASMGATVFIEGLEAGLRLGGEIDNVNSIGITCASTALIAFWRVLYKKNFRYLIPLFLCTLVAFATGSRKALLAIVVAIIFLFVLKGNSIKKLGFVFLGALVLVGLYFILQLPIFSGIMSRTERFLNLFLGEGRVDTSTLTRLEMIEAGWQEFLKAPLGGVGVGNSSFITEEYIGRSTYLHNNYIELLATTGIIGTVIYYLLHFIPIRKLFGLVRKQNDEAILVVVIIINRLVQDIAVVDYYSKSGIFYILVAWIFLSKVNKGLINEEAELKIENAEENTESV